MAGEKSVYKAFAGRFFRAGRRKAQVVVELMLVLPVFFLLLFLIMEIGNLAYQTILAHHAAYELARIGSLVAGPAGGSTGSANRGLAEIKMRSVMLKMFPRPGQAALDVGIQETGSDPQAAASGGTHRNEDLLVTLTYNARLIFPGSSFVLSDPPKQKRSRKIVVRLRMPIEKPVFQ